MRMGRNALISGTTSDAAWTQVVATPNHPEYPAAHSCTFGALGETLRQYYGTRQWSASTSTTACVCTAQLHSGHLREALEQIWLIAAEAVHAANFCKAVRGLSSAKGFAQLL